MTGSRGHSGYLNRWISPNVSIGYDKLRKNAQQIFKPKQPPALLPFLEKNIIFFASAWKTKKKKEKEILIFHDIQGVVGTSDHNASLKPENEINQAFNPWKCYRNENVEQKLYTLSKDVHLILDFYQ